MEIRIYYKRTNAIHIVRPERVDGDMREYVSAITNGDFKRYEVIK